MDLYFQRHDGEAVTIEDFLRCMEEANDADLGQFRLWYSQAGTPEVGIEDEHDPASATYTLRLTQRCPPTPGQPEKQPMHIPVAVGLLRRDGREVPLQLEGETAPGGTTRVLSLREASQTFRFVGVPERPVTSLMRGFSAPVKLRGRTDDATLAFLAGQDTDPFSRWNAGQLLLTRTLLAQVAAIQQGQAPELPEHLVAAVARTLDRSGDDPAMAAEALLLPSESYLADEMAVADPDAVHQARNALRAALARALADPFLATYTASHEAGPYRFTPESAGRRTLKNTCLAYLAELPEHRELAWRQFQAADNMTDVVGALSVLASVDSPRRVEALEQFHTRWRHEPLVLDKWFGLQATSRLPGTLDEVRRLLAHPDYDEGVPNRVRALVGAFAQGNPARFHLATGEGYTLLADQILRLDPRNPQLAARMLGPMTRWRRFDPGRQRLLRGELERILTTPALSRDVYEVAAKSLAA
jgi:aminopeptidase N